MKFRNLITLFLVLFCHDKNKIGLGYLSKSLNEFQIDNIQHFQSNQFQPKIDNCKTLVIFDLTKNIVSKEIFDVSIKIFLKYIFEQCNNFAYVMLNDNFNGCGTLAGCNTTVTGCDKLNGCEQIIESMEYISVASSYPNDLYIPNSTSSINYMKFLKEIFAEFSICKDKSTIILTNRVIYINTDPILQNSDIKLTAILLGRNESYAQDVLESEYQKIPNAKTLSFQNYDCLSYLFYCILNCSDEKTAECMKEDIDDCQVPTISSNSYPNKTLHIWFVMAFVNNAIQANDIKDILNNMFFGIDKYTRNYDIRKVRIRYVYGAEVTLSTEDVNSICKTEFAILMTDGDVINDDRGYINSLLSLVPWSGTLTKARIGFLSIIILTNYASMNLITEKDGQKLQGQMFIYNQRGFEYYSRVIKNDTNFQFSPLNYSDSYSIFPLINEDPKTTTVTSISTSSRGLTSTTATDHSSATTLQSLKSTVKSSKNTTEIFIIMGPCTGILIVISVIGFVIYRKRKQRLTLNEDYRANRVGYATKTEHETSVHDEWELSWDNLVIKSDELYVGAHEQLLHGKLLKGINQETQFDDNEVAIKMPKEYALRLTKDNFFKEIQMMKLLSGNTNIVKMHGCITAGDEICMILEFCSNLDLHTFVKSLQYSKNFLASKGIIHRNLTAKNILIDSNKNAKISDFGLAIESNKNDEIVQDIDKKRLPAKWMAIESLKNFKFSFASDIWSFGNILYEMYSFGEIPFEYYGPAEQLTFLEDGNRLNKPDFCSDENYEIMLKCWMKNPFERPKISELIKSFSQLLKDSAEGYGYLEVLDFASSTNNDELVRQFTSLVDES